MDFLLPEFKTDFLEFFYACARIDDPSKELLTWVSKLESDSDHVETSFETSKGTAAWIIAIANTVNEKDGGETSYVHFHLSAALSSFFSTEKNEETPTHTLAQLNEFCEQFANETLDIVKVRSKFVIPQDELPERSVALLLGTKATVGGKKIVIDNFEAKFEDIESPHARMEWSTHKKDDSRVFFLNSRYKDREFSSEYMRDHESKLKQDLYSLILEKKTR